MPQQNSTPKNLKFNIVSTMLPSFRRQRSGPEGINGIPLDFIDILAIRAAKKGVPGHNAIAINTIPWLDAVFIGYRQLMGKIT